MMKTVIFDMDGVIIDSEPIHFELEKAFFGELGIDISPEEHLSFTGRSAKNVFTYLKRAYELPQSVEFLEQTSNQRYIDYLRKQKDLQPIDGVAAFIHQVVESGLQLVLASSATMKNIEIVLEKLQFSHLFPLRVSGAALVHSKPHPGIFLRAAKLSHTSPANCVVIEDTDNGLKAAKAAGMRCIGFKNPNSGTQKLEQADLIIRSFSEIDVQTIFDL